MAIALLMMSVLGLSAQVTTSALSGLVIDEMNEPVVGCTVQAVHLPSGTRYGIASNIDGRYSIEGMKAGGPYTVTISYLGMQNYVVKDVTLNLGDTYVLDAKLQPATTELKEVVVSAVGGKFGNEKTGASTNISQAQMTAMPTVSRSISDIAKLSPYANGMSFAGGDGRSTNFTVDGANFNNNFGLSSSLPGGGNPISLDAIQEMQVVVAPFDVRQTNFIGGGINAVTKSGTNRFNGTAYTYYTNQDLRGNRIDGRDLGARVDGSRRTYGFTLGGPIIKDKLFFFVNYENEKQPYEVVKYRPAQEGQVGGKDMISRVTEKEMQMVYDHLKNVYGYDAGSYTNYPGSSSNYRFLGRLDWNIVDGHRLSVRFNTTKNTAWNETNGSSSDTGYRLQDSRIGVKSMAFSNSMYSMENAVSTWAAELNSRFSNSFSNQLLGTFTAIRDTRGTNSSPFPFIDIMAGLNDVGNQILEPYMTAGYELFTYNNGVKNNTLSIIDNATFVLGNHKLTGGLSFEHQFANNAYMRNGTGYYRYRSIDDFLSGAAPESFALTYGYNGEKSPNAQVTFNQAGVYAQDEWNITRRFLLTYGARFDWLGFDNSDLQTNDAIKALDFGGRSIDTGKWPTSKVQISPRVGFTWDVFGDKNLKLRGGTGLFAGRLPLVFFTNMPTNSNMVQNSVQFKTTYNSDGSVKSRDPRLDQLAGKMLTNVDDMIAKFNLPTSIEKHVAGTKISGVDSDFKMPQVWKSSFAADYKIPVSFPFTATAEFMYTKAINAVTMENINILDPNAEGKEWERFKGADNRLIYPSTYQYIKGTNAVVLTNTNKGYGYTANITLNARPIESLALMLAYTHTESKEISGMPGSDPVAAWQNLVGVEGPNFTQLQRSRYVVPDRLTGSATWTIPFTHNGLKRNTNISLFYNAYSANGDSWIYTNDMNGDGNATDAMYIPRNDDEIKFVSEADRKAFWAFVEQDPYLSTHKGQYAEAFAARSPWVNKFDLRIMEEFEFMAGKTKNAIQISFDFMNIGNLINSNWGVSKTMVDCNYGKILTYDAKATKANGMVPTFSMWKNNATGEYPTYTYSTYFNNNQCWQLQLGVKYIFKQ